MITFLLPGQLNITNTLLRMSATGKLIWWRTGYISLIRAICNSFSSGIFKLQEFKLK